MGCPLQKSLLFVEFICVVFSSYTFWSS